MQIRSNHLLKKASAVEIENNKTAKNTIININRIEKTIKMWKIIQFTTSKKTTNSIQIIDIPTDLSISLNDIKGNKNVTFKKIDDLILIEELIADCNTHHLDQAQGSPFTVKPLRTLLVSDSDTAFAEALLQGKANLKSIHLTKVTKRNLESMTRN